MALWAFILSVIYVPGWTGAAIPTGWAFLSASLPLMIWRGRPIPWPLQALIGIFLVYSILSLTWTINRDAGIYVLWMHTAILGAFIVGYKLESLDSAMRGFALGLGVSSLLCIAQWSGWRPVLSFDPLQPVGLLYNPSISGQAFAVIILWLALRQHWRYIPILVPGLWLNETRSWWVGLTLPALAYLLRRDWRWTLAVGACAIFIGWNLIDPGSRDQIRVALWRAFYDHLTIFGRGAGAIANIRIDYNGQLINPEYAHSVPLDLAFQYGVGVIPLFALAAIPLFTIQRPEWYVYLTLLSYAVFSFPLHVPILAAMLALLAGNLSSNWSIHGLDRSGWRFRVLPRYA